MTQSRDGMPPALLLAAGVGRRLGDMTAALPKALIEVHGETLLERSLRALEAAGFREGLIVTGHAAATVDSYLEQRRGSIHVRSVFNPRFAEANNIVSLLVAGEFLQDGFCLLNTDIIFEPSVLVDVFAAGDGAWLVVDGDEPLGAEEMKVQVDHAGRMTRINKKLPPETSVGEYIGIVRFDAHGARLVLDAASRLVAEGGTNLYYEDAMDSAATELQAQLIPTRRRLWTEVDDLADYERAQRVGAALDENVAARL